MNFRRYTLAILMAIPMVLTFKTFSYISEWYYFIPLGLIVYVNFLALAKLVLPNSNEVSTLFKKEDVKMLLSTGTLLVLFFLIAKP